jgi:hypothetical protein
MARVLLFILIGMLMAAGIVSAGLVRLGYDDGSAEDAVWMDDLRGHAVVFDAPCDNWTLSEVEVLGKLAPERESEMMVVEVWDRNLSLLSKTVDRSKSFFGENFTWSVIDLPDVKVSGSFIVSFYEFAGVYTAADTNLSSGRSILTARNPNRILSWDVENLTYNQTNWMIRALGSSPAPNIRMQVLSDKASQSTPAKVRVLADDPDGNLKSAILSIVDNKTTEIVWTEVKEMTGSSAEAQFSWPGTMLQIAADGISEGPILAVKGMGIPENLSDLLDLSAPSILELETNVTVSAMAYFGKDGKLNALIGLDGFTHYLSQDAVNRTSPGVNYQDFLRNNTTIIKGKSRIAFLKESVPSGLQNQSMAMIGPITISDEPLLNIGLDLKQVSAGAGDYLAVVQVSDSGLNTVSSVGEKPIKVV